MSSSPCAIPVAIEIAVITLTDDRVKKAIQQAPTDSLKKYRNAIWEAVWGAARDRLGRYTFSQVEIAFMRLRDGPEGEGQQTGRNPLSPFLVSSEQLAKRYLTIHKGRLAINFDRIIEAQSIFRRVNICLLRAYALVTGCHQLDPWEPSADRVLHQCARAAILPPPAYFLLDELFGNGLVEVHRHMNISTLAPILWVKWMEQLENGKDADPPKTKEDLEAWEKDLERISDARKLRDGLIRLFYKNKHRSKRSIGESLRRLVKNPRLFDSKLSNTYRKRYRGHVGEFKLVFNLLKLLNESWLRPDYARIEPAVHLYMLHKCWFMSRVQQPVEDSRGLNRFVKIYGDSALRSPYEQDTPDRLIQAYRTGRVFWLEGRWTPKNAIKRLTNLKKTIAQRRRDAREGEGKPSRLFSLLRNAQENKTDEVLLPDETSSLPGVGCIFHFVKKEAENKPLGIKGLPIDARYEKARWKGWVEADGIVEILYNSELRPLLLGLDICGSEASTCAGTFSPQIRYIRSMSRRIPPKKYFGSKYKSPADLDELGGIRVTCHGGEDFNHILGGLRHMEEAIHYLDLSEGDRIGHGIALGLSPADWREAFGQSIHLRVGEWLDDLVWLFAMLGKTGAAPGVLIEVENLIQRYSSQIYGMSVPPCDLEDAWLLRAEDPVVARKAITIEKILNRAPKENLLLKEWLTQLGRQRLFSMAGYRFALDSLRMALGVSTGEKSMTGKRILRNGLKWWLCYHFDRSVRYKWQEIIEVEIKKSWIEAIEAAQALLTQMIVEKKIILEINPSSNLTITPIDKLQNHPVFRWLDPKRGTQTDDHTPFVVIGSDDPGVFCTELIHEYGLLARAAEELGASPRQIRDWLIRLRQSSLEFSFFPKKAFRESSMRE